MMDALIKLMFFHYLTGLCAICTFILFIILLVVFDYLFGICRRKNDTRSGK